MQDIIDVLLDEDNKDPIVLRDGNGRKIIFDQIFVLPEDRLYCILKPVEHIDGVAEDEGIVFFVDEGENEDDEPLLKVETDVEKCIDIFEQYYSLLEEELPKVRRE